jgi:hypothetical protein
MTDIRYRIEEDEDWIIVWVRDPGLARGGHHRVNRDGGRPLIFADQATAQQYAEEVFAGRQQD